MNIKAKAVPEGFDDYPSTRVFHLSTKGFRNAKLLADGTLELEMQVSKAPVWNEQFVAGLQSDFGDKMNGTLDRLTDELNKEIAVRILLD